MKRTSLLFSSVIVGLILASGVGCARKPDDAKISSEIQIKFSQDSGLSSKQLTVQADGGVVTIAGTVDNDAQREAAGKQAASVSGVKTVINNLQVGTASAAASSVASTPASPAMTTSASTPPPGENSKPVPVKKSSKTRSGAKSSRSGNAANADETADNSQAPPAPAQDTPAASTDNAAATAPPPPPMPKKLIIDEGTQLTVRLIDPIDSEKNQTGDTFRATLNAPLTSDGEEAVPAGVELTGHLVDVKSAGKFKGQSAVAMQLDSLKYGGQTYSLQSDQYKKTGSSRGKNTAEKVGGGAIIGGIIGAIAGGGKGAAIGSAAGAGVGGGVQAASKSEQIKLPSETVLNFTLQEPITVVKAPGPDANRPKLGDAQ
jgi:outer membrane lipoprotein SlyB